MREKEREVAVRWREGGGPGGGLGQKIVRAFLAAAGVYGGLHPEAMMREEEGKTTPSWELAEALTRMGRTHAAWRTAALLERAYERALEESTQGLPAPQAILMEVRGGALMSLRYGSGRTEVRLSTPWGLEEKGGEREMALEIRVSESALREEMAWQAERSPKAWGLEGEERKEGWSLPGQELDRALYGEDLPPVDEVEIRGRTVKVVRREKSVLGVGLKELEEWAETRKRWAWGTLLGMAVAWSPRFLRAGEELGRQEDWIRPWRESP